MVPTGKDPTKFVSGAPVLTFPAPPAPAVSHPHMALEVGKEVFIPDLVRTIFSQISRCRSRCGSVPTLDVVKYVRLYPFA